MQHIHLAPPIDDDGVSPFVTPHTRLTWSTGIQWARVAFALERRRASGFSYVQQAEHLRELARHPAFIQAQPLEDLELMLTVIDRHNYKPHRGARAGTAWERVLNEVNNAIAARRREEGAHATVGD